MVSAGAGTMWKIMLVALELNAVGLDWSVDRKFARGGALAETRSGFLLFLQGNSIHWSWLVAVRLLIARSTR